MGSTITLAVISVSAWLIITFLSVYGAYRENPAQPRGVSLLEIMVMPALVFAVGYGINLLYESAGTWIVLVSHSGYIVLGVIWELREELKRQKARSNGRTGGV
jgi:ABC-type spermidine/putrescine transport system permease subunit II